ncbi:anti-anti-sigma factor [Mycolicibacterium celeriflavum]|uniref:STAS domain-containing protein n=1 Tax=Mycolicibacterium celeriflavum TaxID=1249101 RepID=UPI0007FC84B5|nr:STAS domain-containing protein [Mycolicibacterium celeriflavum]MCV7238409.1 STAS domain-containing protein [Mycolicibacterium celeriflavum]OBG14054.1 anti-anti-sigma factor [Mycolicibacterium celeriflavum]ORA46628.1 anti-anti-sigma factor [Mycolicibacterium celeriflavum]
MSRTDPISTSISYEGGIAVLKVGGDVDLATVPAFQAAITEALTQEPSALVVDLSAVDFLASAGLQALVATHESVSKAARFAVVADGPATSRPIQLTGLDQVFSLYSTLDEALAALKSG